MDRKRRWGHTQLHHINSNPHGAANVLSLHEPRMSQLKRKREEHEIEEDDPGTTHAVCTRQNVSEAMPSPSTVVAVHPVAPAESPSKSPSTTPSVSSEPPPAACANAATHLSRESDDSGAKGKEAPAPAPAPAAEGDEGAASSASSPPTPPARRTATAQTKTTTIQICGKEITLKETAGRKKRKHPVGTLIILAYKGQLAMACKANSMVSALEIYREMKIKGIKQDLSTHLMVLSICGGSPGERDELDPGNGSTTPRVAANTEAPASDADHRTEDASAQANTHAAAEAALQIFSDASNGGAVSLPESAYTAVIRACCLDGRVDRAREVLQALKQADVRPRVRTYAPLLEAYSQLDGRLQDCVDIWRDAVSAPEGGQPGVTMTEREYLYLIAACTRARNEKCFLEVMEEYIDDVLQPRSRHSWDVLKAWFQVAPNDIGNGVTEDKKPETVAQQEAGEGSDDGCADGNEVGAAAAAEDAATQTRDPDTAKTAAAVSGGGASATTTGVAVDASDTKKSDTVVPPTSTSSSPVGSPHTAAADGAAQPQTQPPPSSPALDPDGDEAMGMQEEACVDIKSDADRSMVGDKRDSPSRCGGSDIGGAGDGARDADRNGECVVSAEKDLPSVGNENARESLSSGDVEDLPDDRGDEARDAREEAPRNDDDDIGDGGGGVCRRGFWSVVECKVDKDGTCKNCGEVLRSIDLSPDDERRLLKQIEVLVCTNEQRTKQWEGYCGWLDRRGKERYNVIIDGANVGYFKQAGVCHNELADLRQVDWAVKKYEKEGRKPLVVLHSRHLVEKRLSDEAKEIYKRWKEADMIQSCAPKNNDDWYWLYAAVYMGGKVLVLTNDEMRDHHFSMLSHRSFQRWKERHQARFTFGDWNEEGDMRELVVDEPRLYSKRTQKGVGSWHVPLEHSSDWLCARWQR